MLVWGRAPSPVQAERSSAVACAQSNSVFRNDAERRNAKPMRAAVIFGLGTSPADLKPFQAGSPTKWLQGLPASSSDADAILIFGGDGTIHRHLPALVRLQLPVLIVPAGSGNDFARALNLRSTQDSLRVWRDFEAGKLQPRAIDLGVIVPSASPDTPIISAASPGAVWTPPPPAGPIRCRAGCADTAVMRWRFCRCCSNFRLIRCG